MQDQQLSEVFDAVTKLDKLVDTEEDPAKVRTIAHGLAATALKALQDADTAKAASERAYSRGFAAGAEQENPPEALEPEEVAGGEDT